MDINKFVSIGTRGITEQLTTDELVALYMAATAGLNPKEIAGYEKAKGLFTEFDGTKMHTDVLKILDGIVSERLEEKRDVKGE